MALKSKVDKSKPTREVFVQNGAAMLFKKKDAPVSNAKGIRILPLLPDSTKDNPRIDFNADGYVIWFSNLDDLRTGVVGRIPVYLAPYRPKPEG